MAQHFDTIDAYIKAQPQEHQATLQELRAAILKIAPKETTEAISYQMPTFRYHGNLIHFALFKKHIGLYPGADAIAAHQELLGPFKTTKGAIQIPLGQPLPKHLLQSLIDYNVVQLKDKKGPNWHESRGDWDACNQIMEELIVTIPELTKTHKWGSDVYTYDGKNVIAWGGFKSFFSLWFYNGVFLQDKAKVLVSASEGKTKSLRQWRFTHAEDMPTDSIKQYILESIQTIKDGKAITIAKTPTLLPNDLFLQALNDDPALRTAFDGLTPGKRNEYVEYINSAKQEKTQLSRLEKIKPMILQGIGLHDKYKR